MACVRVCPVQAVAVENDRVRIVQDTCIECGLCAPACHHDAIEVVGDFDRVALSVERGKALLILPTEAIIYFYPATPNQVINACYETGFRGVFFDVLGDELVAKEYLRLWRKDGNRTWLRSTNPIVVDYCRTMLPELLPFLVPVAPPPVALARLLRTLYAEETEIVYAGLSTPGPNGNALGITSCISLSELERLLEESGVSPDAQPETLRYIPPERRRHFSTAGGLPIAMLNEEPASSRRFQKLRGLNTLTAVARAVIEAEEPLGFVDILPFEGNLDHPALGPKENLYWRKKVAAIAEARRSEEPVIDECEGLDLSVSFGPKVGVLPFASDEEMRRVLAKIGTAPGDRHWNCGACGHELCVDFARAVARGRGSLSVCPYYIGRQLEQASEDAMHDGLTGLYAYRVLKQRLDEEVARSRRTGTSLALLFLDLDNFKPVNDKHGHAAGNDLLRAVANVMHRAIRATDIACRFGGDEFVIILVNADRQGVARVADDIRHNVELLRISTDDAEIGVTLSIGVAYNSGVESPDVTAESMMAEADASLYVAKAHGGNAVHPTLGGQIVR